MTKPWDLPTALSWLGGNYRWPGGFIRPRAGYTVTDLDRSAIQYLVDCQGFVFEEVTA
jgi:hypothetical protein